MMKKHFKWGFVVLLTISLFACQSASNEKDEDLTEEENTELEKVETIQKTEKEKSDSVRKYWEEKMEKSKVGDE